MWYVETPQLRIDPDAGRCDIDVVRHQGICKIMNTPILMTPGPVGVSSNVLAAAAYPVLPHYGPTWMPIYEETCSMLKQLFGTINDIVIMPGPGTGALETAITSTVSRDSTAFIPKNGYFSERLEQITVANGINVVAPEFPKERSIDVSLLAELVQKAVVDCRRNGHPLVALVVVHVETSTGVINPLEDIAKIAHEHNLFLIVDAVAAMGGVKLPVDEWKIDICVTVPNKCIASLAGVALMSVSERSWAAALANPCTGWYLNLTTWADYRRRWAGWFPYPTTLPTNIVLALNYALTDIFNEGLDAFQKKFEKAATKVRHEMGQFGLQLFPNPDSAAPVLSAFTIPKGISSVDILNSLYNSQILAAGGIDDLKGKIIRIGHMGEAQSSQAIATLTAAMETYFNSKKS